MWNKLPHNCKLEDIPNKFKHKIKDNFSKIYKHDIYTYTIKTTKDLKSKCTLTYIIRTEQLRRDIMETRTLHPFFCPSA